MSFADLKQSKLGSLTAKLVKEVEKMNTTGSSGDERLWKLDVDKSGNGYAVIRFLPAPNGEDLPFVKLYSHAFQGPGGWFIENSLTTMGQKILCLSTILCCGTTALMQVKKQHVSKSVNCSITATSML